MKFDFDMMRDVRGHIQIPRQEKVLWHNRYATLVCCVKVHEETFPVVKKILASGLADDIAPWWYEGCEDTLPVYKHPNANLVFFRQVSIERLTVPELFAMYDEYYKKIDEKFDGYMRASMLCEIFRQNG